VGFTGLTLTSTSLHRTAAGPATATLAYSTNAGGSWTTISTYAVPTTETAFSVSIPAAGEGAAQFCVGFGGAVSYTGNLRWGDMRLPGTPATYPLVAGAALLGGVAYGCPALLASGCVAMLRVAGGGGGHGENGVNAGGMGACFTVAVNLTTSAPLLTASVGGGGANSANAFSSGGGGAASAVLDARGALLAVAGGGGGGGVRNELSPTGGAGGAPGGAAGEGGNANVALTACGGGGASATAPGAVCVGGTTAGLAGSPAAGAARAAAPGLGGLPIRGGVVHCLYLDRRWRRRCHIQCCGWRGLLLCDQRMQRRRRRGRLVWGCQRLGKQRQLRRRRWRRLLLCELQPRGDVGKLHAHLAGGSR
jgi:hypothetical protein